MVPSADTPQLKIFQRIITHLLICALVLMPYAGQSVRAQGLDDVIYEIQINGLKSLTRDFVLSKIRSKESGYFYPSQLKEDLKRLYNTGLFAQVDFESKKTIRGVVLVIDLVEKPILIEISYDGNKKIRKSDLEKLIQSKAGSPADEAKITRDIRAMIEKYIEKGYPNADIDYKLDINPNRNEAALTFIIDEGKQIQIKDVSFNGNTAFTDKELSKLMKTKKATIWPLNSFFGTGIYNEETFAEDVDRVEDFYHYKGYLDAKIVDIKKDISPKKDKMRIVISVEEGPTYKAGDIEISGNSIFPTRSLRQQLKMETDTHYSPERLGNDVRALQDFYFDRGYIETRIASKVTFDPERQAMNIQYRISESSIFYVNKIDIQGNYKTKDKVIRRELIIYPGEVFNGSKIKTSRARLENTGFFEKVETVMVDAEEENRKNVVIELKEKKTGAISFGAGFSSIDSFIGFTEFSQSNFDLFNFKNFQGAGQKLRVRFEAGNKRQNFLVSFTDPYFLDKKLLFGFDTFVDKSDYLSSDYDEDRVGVRFRLGKAFSHFIRGEVSLSIEQIDVNVDEDASAELLREEETYDQVSVAFQASRDTRNRIMFPSRGARTVAILKLSGGTEQYTRLDLRSNYYMTPFSKFPEHVIQFRQGLGVVGGMSGGRVPLFDRMFLGGATTVRGFEYREIGPQDINDEPVGGKLATWGSIEYNYPIIERVVGALFIDGGNVYNEIDDLGTDYNVGIGFGFRLNLPIGPMRVDIGFPVVTDDYTDDDAKPRVHFGMGTSF